jgi:DNA repair protein RadC
MKKSLTIHDLPASDRPRERLQHFGPESLSEQEILAIVLGSAGKSVTETARALLSTFGDLKTMSTASLEELSKVSGIGPAKASQLRAAFEMARRIDATHPVERTIVRTPEEVNALVGGELRDKKKEVFIVILLDTRGHLIRRQSISIGSLDTSIVHPREVFKEAIAASAASVIFVHNHPSGDTRPSQDDIQLTKRLVEAGDIVGIDVLDHVIIGGKNFLSLKREGLF